MTFDGQPNPPAYVLREASPAFTKLWMIPDCNGVVTIPSGLRKPAGNKPVYVAAGDVTVVGLPEGYGLTSRDGAAARVGFFEGATAFAGVHAGDSLELRPFDPGWRMDALLWIDPSNDATIFKHYKAGSYQSYYQPLTFTTATVAPDSGYVVEGIADVRGAERTTMRMWNGRSYMNFYKAQGTSNAGYEQLDSVFPFLSTACSSNGLPYLAFGEYGNSRRLQFVDFVEGRTVTNAVSNYTTIAPKFAVLVFGSQKGGGNSILGTWDKLFARSGQTLNDPIMKKKVDMWINGASVDPTTEKFSGGWDVISIKFPANTTVAGIGCENGATASTSGGKYLGEMVFLSSEPDEKTRQDIERYLAKKWGILGKYAGERKPAGAVNLAGSGVVSVSQESALTLSGSFAGTLNLAAGVEARVSGTRPGSEEDVRNLEPVLWIDPSAEGAISYDDATKHSVGNIYQHDVDKRTIETDLFLTSNHGGRSPVAWDGACAFGSARTWIDYNGVPGSHQGNTMRVHRVDDSKPASDVQVQMRTGFIVQDSCRGGGTPFLDNIYGTADVNALVRRRVTSDPSHQIYESATSDLLKKGNIYLNGQMLPYANGFTGGPEVFTFTATDLFPVGYFGCYVNSEGRQQGEIQGEILLFADLLDDSDRGKVESYLMQKWLGWIPAAYADYSAATLDGAGTLEVANADAAPSLASTFAGTLTVTETADFKMTLLADEQVEGALVAPQATLALPATATLTLSAVGKVEPGTYTLIDVADVGEAAFALDAAFSARYSSAKLVRTGGKVTVKVPVSGAMIILR
ncbi:MAG: hypothetical protein Q4G65_11200 [bacterium]|nr:hypothetical protein [bacterium]